MRRAYLLLLLLIWLASRCSHTHAVSRQAEPSTAPADEGARGEAGGKHERHAAVTGERAQPEHETPPLATSPAGLLQPGAIAAVQDKLIARGYLVPKARSQKLDGETEKALRDFQRDQGLPATGMPDDSTMGKLGLSPHDIFRAAPKGGDKP